MPLRMKRKGRLTSAMDHVVQRVAILQRSQFEATELFTSFDHLSPRPRTY